MNSAAPAGKLFQPNQIVFLEHATTRLYAEVVQFVESRGLCWVRPLAFVDCQASMSFETGEETSTFPDWTDYDRLIVEDLRQGSDLMCPAILFEEALDTQVIPLVFRLHELENSETKIKGSTTHQRLQQFIQQIWQARPEAFSTSQA